MICVQTFLHYCQSYNVDEEHWFRKREMKVSRMLFVSSPSPTCRQRSVGNSGLLTLTCAF